VAYLASAAFLQLSYQRYFWFLLALANGTAWLLRREAAHGTGAQPVASVALARVRPARDAGAVVATIARP
jgi:hypothetical protein